MMTSPTRLDYARAEQICQQRYQEYFNCDLGSKTPHERVVSVDSLIDFWRFLPETTRSNDRLTQIALEELCKLKLEQTLKMLNLNREPERKTVLARELDQANEEMTFVVNSLHRRGIESCCILGSVILQKRLEKKGIQATIVSGYFIVENLAGRHFWVQLSNGFDLDVGHEVQLLHHPELRALPKRKLIEELPSGIEVLDTEGTSKKMDEIAVWLKNSNLKRYLKFLRTEPGPMLKAYRELAEK